uniref:CCHC-type domain-containing protein n=1 Tax=Tanacetum cinerariifolium TaxID=118510 RepID=A0A6L2M897_TANCI|nr:hypothetical protein [Tanacetum cinerariifolium]
MNYLKEKTDGEAKINCIKHGDQPLPLVTQVSIVGTSSTEQPPLKDKSIWSDQEKKIQKIDRLTRSIPIQGLSNDICSLIYSHKTAKDLWDALARHMLGSEYEEQDRKAVVLYEYETFKATEGELLLDTYIRYLQVINDLKKCGYLKDNCELNFKFLNNLQPEWKQYATMMRQNKKMRQNKNSVDINIDALYNILKQNQGDVNDAMGLKKKTVVVTSDPLALIAEKTKSANKKQEYVKSDDKKVKKKDDEKKQDMSKVKCYNCKKEGHFAKDCKKAKVKDYEYYKTKMLFAKKDKDEQVLLAEDRAWMESNSDLDQEIIANMVFMAQIEKGLSDSEASSSSVDDKIFEVSYHLSESKSEYEYETSEYYDNTTNYDLFVNDNDDQEIFHDCENFLENLIESQIDHNESAVDHNDSEGINKLIRKFNKKIDKCLKRIEKVNQQNKDFENQNKDLQDKYDVSKNQATTFEMKNKELNEKLKVMIEKNNNLLAQTNVLKDQLQVKHVVIDTHVECQEKYAKLEAERYEYMIRYSAYFNNDIQHRKQIANQEVLYDKMSVQLVELDKHVRDPKNTVLEKDFIFSELEECVRNKDLEIEKSLERLNVCENKLHKIAKYLRLTLYDERVINLGYTLMFLTHYDEALEIVKFKRARENKIEFAYDYGNLNASYVNEKINFSDDYFQEIINPDFKKIDSLFQQTSSLKLYVPTMILEKIIIDLEDEVVSLLEKDKENLKTIESLNSKDVETGVESSEKVVSETENKSKNDCQVIEKVCDSEENPNEGAKEDIDGDNKDEDGLDPLMERSNEIKDAEPAMACTANDFFEWKDFPNGLRVVLLDEDIKSVNEIRSKLEEMDYMSTENGVNPLAFNPAHNSKFSLLSILGRERVTCPKYMDQMRNLRFTLRLESLNMVFDAELSINIILSGLPADYNQSVLSYQMNEKETAIMELHSLLQTANQGIKKIDMPSNSAAPVLTDGHNAKKRKTSHSN